MNYTNSENSKLSDFLFRNRNLALFWLVVRVYVGWQWLIAGWEKIHNDIWVGTDAGHALSGFVNGALVKTAGAHPDVQGWYGLFLENIILPHATFWSYLVSYGELLVGVALIIGLFVGVAAFFGFFMNLNYLLAGTISINPILLVLSVGLMLAWRVAGWIGLDRFLGSKKQKLDNHQQISRES